MTGAMLPKAVETRRDEGNINSKITLGVAKGYKVNLAYVGIALEHILLVITYYIVPVIMPNFTRTTSKEPRSSLGNVL